MTMMTIANSAGGKTNLEDFALADKLRDASNEDSELGDAKLLEKLRALFPPAPPKQEGPPSDQG